MGGALRPGEESTAAAIGVCEVERRECEVERRECREDSEHTCI